VRGSIHQILCRIDRVRHGRRVRASMRLDWIGLGEIGHVLSLGFLFKHPAIEVKY